MKKFIKRSLLVLFGITIAFFVAMNIYRIWLLRSCFLPGPFYSESTDPNEYLTFELLEDDTYSVTGFEEYPVKNLEIPSYHEGKLVSIIADDAFRVHTIREGLYYDKYGKVETIVIPNTIKEIGERAFFDCTIGNYNLPDSVEIIGNEAFRSDTLGKINVPNNIKKIGSGAFYNKDIGDELYLDDVELEDCSFYGAKVKKVIFSDKFTEIPYGLFEKSSVEEIILPDNCEKINDYAFTKSNLTSLVCGEKLFYIGKYAFEENPLTSVEFNSKNLKLGNQSFASIETGLNLSFNCENIRITDDTFYKTNNIQKIELADNNKDYKLIDGALCDIEKKLYVAPKGFDSFDKISSINDYAFAYHEFDELILKDNLVIGQYAFFFASINKLEVHSELRKGAFSYAKINELKISSKLIPYDAFEYCSNLKKVELLEGVETLKYCSFACAKELETIYMPSTLKDIDQQAFYGNSSLKNIYYNLEQGEPADIQMGNFLVYVNKIDKDQAVINSDLKIYVKKEVYEACKEKWKNIPKDDWYEYKDDIINHLVIWEE